MARGRFRALGQLLPRALEGLAEKAGDAGALGPAWSLALGSAIARVSRPTELRGSTLRVEVDTEAWCKELTAREAELLARLAGPLGGRVKKLSFTVSNRR
jgi:predicted nucleic acid-binding Zn ribbon protein